MTKPRLLFLLRHAKSSWEAPDLIDHDRPLTKRGIMAAGLMGREMVEREWVPDYVICSTSTRTRETLALWRHASGFNPEVSYSRDLYHASAGELFEIVMNIPDKHDKIMLVGHNPGMEQMAMQLCANLGDEPAKELMEKFPTAALAMFEIPNKSWAQTEPGTAKLANYITPRKLMSEKDLAEI